jgi:hypothetical protein
MRLSAQLRRTLRRAQSSAGVSLNCIILIIVRLALILDALKADCKLVKLMLRFNLQRETIKENVASLARNPAPTTKRKFNAETGIVSPALKPENAPQKQPIIESLNY